MKNLTKISPDYPRIAHLDKSISNMTHDDILSENEIVYPIEGYVQEKLDGSNMGASWLSGPILRNRSHILKKGYSKIRTPAKEQFKSAWNWVHDHKEDIEYISDKFMSEITIYGEWMNFTHSIFYDRLPDKFMAYDIWIVEDNKFLSPDLCDEVLSKTSIKFIKPKKVIIESISDIIKLSEMNSDYKDGVSEGIVFKRSDGKFITDMWKVVNKYFERRNDFNTGEIIKNKIIHI
jgi:atypical dual specificity phosphatase